MRNQGMAGSTLPDLSESAEQEKGESFFSLWSTQDGGSCQRLSRVFTSWISGKRTVPVLKKKKRTEMMISCVFVPPCHPFPGRIIIDN